MLEIERKFLIKDLPSLSDYKKFEITQWYCKDWTKNIRIRKKWSTYYMTYKSGKGLVRIEIEDKITKAEFDKLRELVWKLYIKKTRYEIPYGKFTIELDVFKENLKWLIFAEVEFESEDEAIKFKVPKWFGVELTEIEEAKNAYLAKHGMNKLLLQL